MIGCRVTLTTTRDKFEIEHLSQSARECCRAVFGVVEDQHIDELTHEVCISGEWYAIVANGVKIRNVDAR